MEMENTENIKENVGRGGGMNLHAMSWLIFYVSCLIFFAKIIL